MQTKLNEIIVLMSQVNDLYRLKKCMHKWFNIDSDVLVQTKVDINDKYKQCIINEHFDELKNNHWDEFIQKENIKTLKDKYPYFIPDIIKYDSNQRYFTTIKYEFYLWLKINYSAEIIEKHNEEDRIFLEKINNFKVKDKKAVERELRQLTTLINERYEYLNEHLPVSQRHILKKVERVLAMYT